MSEFKISIFLTLSFYKAKNIITALYPKFWRWHYIQFCSKFNSSHLREIQNNYVVGNVTTGISHSKLLLNTYQQSNIVRVEIRNTYRT